MSLLTLVQPSYPSEQNRILSAQQAEGYPSAAQTKADKMLSNKSGIKFRQFCMCTCRDGQKQSITESLEGGGTCDVGSGVEAVGGQVAAVQVGCVHHFFESGARQIGLVRRQALIQLPTCVPNCSRETQGAKMSGARS